MSFRLRLMLLVSLTVAVAVVGASISVYYVDRQQLYAQVDRDLSSSRLLPPFQLAVGANGPSLLKLGNQAAPRFKATSTQIVLPRSLKAVRVTVGPRLSRIAAAYRSGFSTRQIGGVSTRVLTLHAQGRQVEVSTSLLDVDRNLAHLRWLLVFVSLGGIALAALLGALVAGRVIAPLRRLTEQTERIVETGDLSERVAQRWTRRGQPSLRPPRRPAWNTRRVASDAAPAGRRRLARAADADRDTARERRTARPSPASSLHASGRRSAPTSTRSSRR